MTKRDTPRAADVALVAVVPNEFHAGVRECLGAEATRPSSRSTINYYRSLIGGLEILLYCVGRKGLARSSAAISASVISFKPRLVVMFGIAAIVPRQKHGRKPRIGDILVADRIVDASTFRELPGRSLPEPEGFHPCDRQLVNLLRVHSEKRPDVLFGDIISQPHLSKSREYRDKLVRWVEAFTGKPTVIGLEMEGGALLVGADARADYRPRVLLIKGGVDWASYFKTKARQRSVARKVPVFVRDFLNWRVESSRRRRAHFRPSARRRSDSFVDRSIQRSTRSLMRA